MDFIKKLISGILGFVGSILGFVGSILGLVTKLLPGKKKSNGYFLELDEAASDSRPAAKSVKSEVTNGKKPAEPVAAEAPAAPKSEPAKANKTKVEASQNGKAPEPAKAPAAAATKKTPTETTFAPKYLAPSATSSNGRRLPGANMSAYLDMARQVKTRNN